MKHDQPRVSIVILNWNGWKDTIECLESLFRIEYDNYDVIIVDNASKDDSLKKLKEYAKRNIAISSTFFDYLPDNEPIEVLEFTRAETEREIDESEKNTEMPTKKRMIIIKNDKNDGFAEGNNIGIRYAKNTFNPEYFLLLNNDTVVHSEFLSELVTVAEGDQYSGFVGPKVYYYDKKNTIQFTGGGDIYLSKGRTPRIANGEKDNGQYDRTYEVGFVGGSCLLCKREVVDKIGLMDPKYFLYFEETDWCLRGKKAGFKSVYAYRARIWHKGGSSSGGATEAFYLARNVFYFMRKHANKQQYRSFLVYFFGYRFWFTSGVYLVYRRNLKSLASFYRGVIEGLLS